MGKRSKSFVICTSLAGVICIIWGLLTGSQTGVFSGGVMLALAVAVRTLTQLFSAIADIQRTSDQSRSPAEDCE